MSRYLDRHMELEINNISDSQRVLQLDAQVSQVGLDRRSLSTQQLGFMKVPASEAELSLYPN